MKPQFVLLTACLSALIVRPAAAQSDDWRTIEIETTEVTSPDVAISPDGQWLIFTMLGHLFRLPVEGGEAEQLTFGPYYDSDPVFSPDGVRVAFVSDRDGSEGNVFVMDLETRETTQVTHERWAGRPAWSPNGRSLLYLSYAEGLRGRWCQAETRVHELELESNAVRVLDASERAIRSVFYTIDGHAGWSVVEPADEDPAETRVEVVTDEGSPSVVATIAGTADRVAPSPDGSGFYARRQRQWNTFFDTSAHIIRVSEASAETAITDVNRRYCWYSHPRFALAQDGRSLFIGAGGNLWRVSTADGAREEIPFRAAVHLQIAAPTPVPNIALPRVSETPTVSSPRLTPDGRALIFGALGFLWRQRLDGGPAERLTEDDAFEREPAISPDGRHLAYVRGADGQQEIRVLDLESGADRTIHRGDYFWDLTWHPSGEKLVVASRGRGGFSVMGLDLADPGKEQLITRTGGGRFSPRPHFSRDGQWLYYRFDAVDTATIQRLSLAADAEPQPVAKMPSHLSHALVSPDGRWLAFRRNAELWIAPLDDDVTTVSEERARQLSHTGGVGFAFTPDGQSLIYAAEGRVWKRSLTDDAPGEVPIQLVVDREVARPLLLRRVRVLDFSSGAFGPEVSMFVEGGRIRWIDSESEREVPLETQVLDAEGRYAIPGLLDFHNHVGFVPTFGGREGDETAYLAYGVTTVRVPGSEVGWVAALAERSSLTSSPIPRYMHAGDFLLGRMISYDERSLWLRSEDQVRSSIQHNKDAGASFIKVYRSLPWPLQLVAAREARQSGLPIAAHSMRMQEVVRGVTLGYTFLEHLEPNSRFHGDVQQLLAISGTYWTPTLSIMGGTSVLFMEEPERSTDAKFCAFFPRSCRRDDEGRGPQLDSPQGQAAQGRQTSQLGTLREARAHGVNVLVGTDNPNFPGVRIHTEMESFVLAGFTPLEVLELSTRRAALALGVAQDLGTLEVGKLADIVLLDSNPLEDIKNTQTIWRVIKGGWVFDPEALRPERN
jgi:Tol biopolymer transport system component